MLTTKNKCPGEKTKLAPCPLRFLTVFALAGIVAGFLSGCGPAGSHALLKGKKLLDEGDYADAADEFKSATEMMTTNAEAWNYLGVAEEHSGQYEEAANAYQRALELDRDLTEAHYNLGCLSLDQNKPDDAVSEFTAYTLRRVNEPDGWLKLGLAQLRTHNLLPAEKSFSTAFYLSPNNAEALNGLGLARMQRDRPDEAEKFFKAAVQYHPEYAPGVLNLATVEHQYMHNDQLALDEYRAYLAMNPHPAEWDAVNALVTTMEQTPPAPASPPQMAQTAPPPQDQVYTEEQPARTEETHSARVKQERQTARAEEDAEREQAQTVPVPPETRVVSAPNPSIRPVQEPDMFASVAPNPPAKSSPDYNPLHWFRSSSPPPTQVQPVSAEPVVRVTPLPSQSSTQYVAPRPVRIVQPAPPVYPRYLYLFPSKPAAGDRRAASAMFDHARQFEAQRRFPDALDSYRRATRLDPSWFEAQYNCGVLAYRLRDYQFSLNAYETALAIEPGSTDARYNFAVALKAAGYVTDAVEQLRKIVAANPNIARAHLELGNIYSQDLYDTARARQEYLKVLQLDPANPQASNIQFWLSANPQ
jgi:Flp pilus assembly protein TadD